jgi:hypothetical protein
MSKNRFLKLYKKLHKWPAIIIAFFAILFAFSGIIMNHRQFFSPVECFAETCCPPNYTYKNWNLAAVRGSVQTGENETLIYGNIGIWKTRDDLKTFEDFNQGFPKGIDNGKIYSVVRLGNTVFAGTQLGLYKREAGKNWEKISLSVEERIADLALKNDTLLVLTRHYLLKSANGTDFITVQLPEPIGYERKNKTFQYILGAAQWRTPRLARQTDCRFARSGYHFSVGFRVTPFFLP